MSNEAANMLLKRLHRNNFRFYNFEYHKKEKFMIS